MQIKALRLILSPTEGTLLLAPFICTLKVDFSLKQTHTILFLLWNPKQKILAALFHTMKANDETVTA